MTGYGRNVIIAGTGNEGAGAGHTGGLLEMGREQVIEILCRYIFYFPKIAFRRYYRNLTGKSGETAF